MNTRNAPLPGIHNYWRGENISTYDSGALKYLKKLEKLIDSNKAKALWTKAAVWIHGDLAVSNILKKDKKLSTVMCNWRSCL
jgi:aminoglycoside phosphotransferase (APT) family kinase protein